MNFGLSEEQEEYRTMVRRFFDERSYKRVARQRIALEEGYDTAEWSVMAQQLGLVGLCIPEEFGGSGYTTVELAIVLQEMGRSLYSGPFFGTVVLGVNAILGSNDHGAMSDLLPRVAAGDLILALAIFEDDIWDLDSITTTATPNGNSWMLNGSKRYVIDASDAQTIIVYAQTGIGPSLFLVDNNDRKLTIRRLETLDETRQLCTVDFNETPGCLLGVPGEAREIIAKTIDLANISLACESAGAAQRCLEMSVDYANSRIQFGRPIGSFQAIKHKCAEVLVEVEAAKAACTYAALAVANNDEQVRSVASMSKAFCADAFYRAASENIQIHGGIGFTFQHDAHLYFKRAKGTQIMFGDSNFHRERVAQMIGL